MIDFYLNNLQNELNVFKLKQKLKKASPKPKIKGYVRRKDPSPQRILMSELRENNINKIHPFFKK